MDQTGRRARCYRPLQGSDNPPYMSPSSPPRSSTPPAITSINLLKQYLDFDGDEPSPQLRNQLSNLLRGQEFRNLILGLECHDLAWFVEFLVNVSLQRYRSVLRIRAQLRCRFSRRSRIPQATCSRDSYMNSKTYVALGKFYQEIVRFLTASSTLAVRSQPAMRARECSRVQKCALRRW